MTQYFYKQFYLKKCEAFQLEEKKGFSFHTFFIFWFRADFQQEVELLLPDLFNILNYLFS